MFVSNLLQSNTRCQSADIQSSWHFAPLPAMNNGVRSRRYVAPNALDEAPFGYGHTKFIRKSSAEFCLRLSQQSLARELGVAQGTVRESLLELRWLGLVESIVH